MKKNMLNYWVDVGIGVSFVLSAVSGLVFLLPVDADPGLGSGILGISYLVWNQLHTWSSLGLMAGVLAHLLLHWKWIVSMTKKTLLPAREPREGAASAPGIKVTRRQFLSLGFAAAATGVIAAGCALIARAWPADAEQENSESAADESGQPVQQVDSAQMDSALDSGSTEPTDSPEPPVAEPVQQQGGVACPRGMVYDPYPGRCRSYTDRNGDGFCDYSVPGSGSN